MINIGTIGCGFVGGVQRALMILEKAIKTYNNL